MNVHVCVIFIRLFAVCEHALLQRGHNSGMRLEELMPELCHVKDINNLMAVALLY